MTEIEKTEKNEKRPARVIVSAILVVMLIVAIVINVRDKKRAGEPLDLPAASEVTVCYYIPDRTRPYEQEWLGGEKLEAVLAELAVTEFTEAEEAPDEGSFRAALVIATNEEQITVHVDAEGRAWAFYEDRWLCERR
jgi:hypothetical protein